jgi:hypothetical protein
LLELESAHLLCFGKEMAFQIPGMSLGEILVFANEDNGRDPKLFRLMLLQSVTDDLRLSDVSAGRVSERIAADQDIDPGFVQFLPIQSLSSSVRGAATALPVQLEISAVRRLFASSNRRKSLIVAESIYAMRLTVPRFYAFRRTTAAQPRPVPLAVRWKHGTMSRVESLEGQVKQLTSEELQAFREWFIQFDSDAWDRQFESDVKSGKLDKLAARALEDYKAGRATAL